MAIIKLTNVLIAGKHIVICGYGYVGKGVASRAEGWVLLLLLLRLIPLGHLKHIWMVTK